jgi:hypothetical protein
MKVIVQRAPGDRPGPDIIDALLVSEPAAIARGRREIDHSVAMRSIENGNCPLLPAMETGSLISVTGARGSYRGKLTMWATTIDISEDGRDFTATTAVSIEREVQQ